MMSNNQEQLSFYRKMAELQDKLRKSEEERAGLEAKFVVLVKQSRAADEARLAALKQKYARFLDEEKRRKIRNEKILTALEKIEKHNAVLTAKTERLKLLRRHFDAYMARTYPAWGERIKKSTEITPDTPPPSYKPPTPGFTLPYIKQEPYIPQYNPPPAPPQSQTINKEAEHFKALMKEKYKIKSPELNNDYTSYTQKTTALRQGDIENIRRSFNDLATPLTDSILDQQTDFNTSRDLLSVTFDNDDPISDNNKENKSPTNVNYKNNTKLTGVQQKPDTSEDEDIIIKKLTKISSFDDEKEDDFNFDPSIRPGTSMGNFNDDITSDEAPEPLHHLVPQELGYHHNDMFRQQPHHLNYIHEDSDDFSGTQKEKIVEEHVPEETVQEFVVTPQKARDQGEKLEKGSEEINAYDLRPKDRGYTDDVSHQDISEPAISYAKSDNDQDFSGFDDFSDHLPEDQNRDPQPYYENQSRYGERNGTILEEDEEITRETYEQQAYPPNYANQGAQNHQRVQEQDPRYRRSPEQFRDTKYESRESIQDQRYERRLNQDQNYPGVPEQGSIQDPNYNRVQNQYVSGPVEDPRYQRGPQQGTRYEKEPIQDPNYSRIPDQGQQYQGPNASQDQRYLRDARSPQHDSTHQRQSPDPRAPMHNQNYSQDPLLNENYPPQDQTHQRQMMQDGMYQNQPTEQPKRSPPQHQPVQQQQIQEDRYGQQYPTSPPENQRNALQEQHIKHMQPVQGQNQPRSPPEDQYQPRSPPQDQNYPRSPPQNHQRSPPQDQYQPRSPPQDQNYPRSPPQDHYQPQSPPQDQNYQKSPPQDQNYPRSPPQDQYQPQSTPQDQNYQRSPPQDQNYPRSPPQDQYQPQSTPQDQNYPRSPPQDQNYPRSPPQTQYQPQSPPQDQNYQRSPPQDQNYPRPQPQSQPSPMHDPRFQEPIQEEDDSSEPIQEESKYQSQDYQQGSGYTGEPISEEQSYATQESVQYQDDPNIDQRRNQYEAQNPNKEQYEAQYQQRDEFSAENYQQQPIQDQNYQREEFEGQQYQQQTDSQNYKPQYDPDPNAQYQDPNYAQEQYIQEQTYNPQDQYNPAPQLQNQPYEQTPDPNNYDRNQYEDEARDQYPIQEPNYETRPEYVQEQPADTQNYVHETEQYASEPQNYVPETQHYAPEPQNYPDTQQYVPESQNYPHEPQTYPDPQKQVPESQNHPDYPVETQQSMYQDDQSYGQVPEEIPQQQMLPPKSNEGFREMELNMPVSERGDTDTLAELDSSELTTTSDMKPAETNSVEPASQTTSSTDEIEKQMAALVTPQEPAAPPTPVKSPPEPPVKTPQSSASTKSSPSSSRPSAASKTPSRPSSGSARSKPPSPAAKKSPTTRSPATKKP